MPSVRDQAICLRVWEWSETSQTVALFARELGVVRALAKGARRADARFSGGLEITARGEMVAIIKPAERSPEAMATLTAWDLQEVFPAVRASLAAFHGAMYMVDLVYHAVRDADPHADLFDALLAGLRSLGPTDATTHGLLRFQWDTLVALGYRPDLLDGQALLGAKVVEFSPVLGRVLLTGTDSDGTRADAGRVWKVRTETMEVLRTMARAGPIESSVTPAAGINPRVSVESLTRANRFLAWYFRSILGTWPASVEGAFPGIGRVEP